ncbi:sensor histidine kinase [Pseudoroseomonas globiformis]|uniref:histidine kinase n=1 Tax=Teichococcus globiformis TaxID=2307229 RepID=A0ABV7G314_9PROT
MNSAFPSDASFFCCLDGVWQLIPHPSSPGAISTVAPRDAHQAEAYIATLEGLNQTLRLEAQRSADQAQFRLAEVEHRLKNTFSTIAALAKQSARRGDTGEAFRECFEARLLALARSHELLGPHHPDGVPLTEVVGRCLQPYDDALARTSVIGPTVHLSPRHVPALGLAFHELTTNAVKYGALSIPEGRVAVEWQFEQPAKDEAPAVAIIWQERNGPTVEAPERRGFGSHLLEFGLAYELGGTAQLEFAPHGVNCRIRMPLTADR